MIIAPSPPTQINKNSCGNSKRDDTGNLRGLEDTDNLTCIIAAKKFQKKSRRRVKHDVKSETLPLNVIRATENQ